MRPSIFASRLSFIYFDLLVPGRIVALVEKPSRRPCLYVQALVSGCGGACYRHEAHDSSGMRPITFDGSTYNKPWSFRSPPELTAREDQIVHVLIELDIAWILSK